MQNLFKVGCKDNRMTSADLRCFCDDFQHKCCCLELLSRELPLKDILQKNSSLRLSIELFANFG